VFENLAFEKIEERIQKDDQTSVCLSLANRTIGRTDDVFWLHIHCVYCVKGKKGKTVSILFVFSSCLH